MNEQQIQKLATLADQLKECECLERKKRLLENYATSEEHSLKKYHFNRMDIPFELQLEAEIVFLSVVVIGQGPVVFQNDLISKEIVFPLIEVERFYKSLGGIVGYHVTILKKLKEKDSKEHRAKTYTRAPGVDLTNKTPYLKNALLKGIETLPFLAMIYPIGGLGVRLSLRTEEGLPLPAAMLPFSGKTLLEGLVRDAQALEYLYYKLFSKPIQIPILMMTSKEEQNHHHIQELLRQSQWFGRPKGSFFVFPQISVPVVTEEGNWSLKEPGIINLQPGGHGALWRMAENSGALEWLQEQGKKVILIRQINNPIAGLDSSLLEFLGIGQLEKKSFGFVSCERLVHAAEGILLLLHDETGITLSNIEYTDFAQHNIQDVPNVGGFSLYPANTNVLYVDLERILPLIEKHPLPGLVLNMKTYVPYIDEEGNVKKALGGRLESMMQNISDAIICNDEANLDVFLTYNERKKTISVTKKSYEKGESLLETPEGAFYDLLYNAHDLLANYCNFQLPPFCSHEEYLEHGPNLIFQYHPALGPLYEVIAYKLRDGRIEAGSELHLEIADVSIDNLTLRGSLLIEAEQVFGFKESLQWTCSHSKTGKCVLKNVSINNLGINRESTSCYWKHSIHRDEKLAIYLQGSAEFYAENITFQGNYEIFVPDNERWIAYYDENQEIAFVKEIIEESSPLWEYRLENDQIKLCLCHTVHRLALQET